MALIVSIFSRLSLFLAVLLFLTACQDSFFAGSKKDGANIVGHVDGNSVDRPSEDSEGVPGYKLVCNVTSLPSPDFAQGDISCALADKQTRRKMEELSSIADEWLWDLQTTEPMHGNYRIVELNNSEWHVRFIFSGTEPHKVADDMLNPAIMFQVKLKGREQVDRLNIPVRELIHANEIPEIPYNELYSLVSSYRHDLDNPTPDMAPILVTSREGLERQIIRLKLLPHATLRWCLLGKTLALDTEFFDIEDFNIAPSNQAIMAYLRTQILSILEAAQCDANSQYLDTLPVDLVGGQQLDLTLQPVIEHQTTINGVSFQSLQLSVIATNNVEFYQVCRAVFETGILTADGRRTAGPTLTYPEFGFSMPIAPTSNAIYRDRQFYVVLGAFELLGEDERFLPELSRGRLDCLGCNGLEITDCMDQHAEAFSNP